MSFRFAHISDLHLPPLPAVALRELVNKRLLGWLSWQRKRKHRHRAEVIAALERVLDEQRPDHICMTGDVTNLGLPREFDAAGAWLERRAAPDAVSFVPGNHDAYVDASIAAMNKGFRRWLPDRFPSVTRRGGATIIGLSSAVATAPFLATGRVGPDQLRSLASILEETASEPGYRILMIHHPPAPGIVGRRKRLTDMDALREVLRARPVDLVLHGHGHRAVRYEIASERGPVPVFGAGAASLSHHETPRTGHFHLFDLDDRALRVTHYHYRPDDGGFRPAGDPQVVASRR